MIMNKKVKLKVGDYIRFKKPCGWGIGYNFGKDVKNTVGKIRTILDEDEYDRIEIIILNNKWFLKNNPYPFKKKELNSDTIEILPGKPSTILYLSNKHFYHQ